MQAFYCQFTRLVKLSFDYWRDLFFFNSTAKPINSSICDISSINARLILFSSSSSAFLFSSFLLHLTFSVDANYQNGNANSRASKVPLAQLRICSFQYISTACETYIRSRSEFVSWLGFICRACLMASWNECTVDASHTNRSVGPLVECSRYVLLPHRARAC